MSNGLFVAGNSGLEEIWRADKFYIGIIFAVELVNMFRHGFGKVLAQVIKRPSDLSAYPVYFHGMKKGGFFTPAISFEG